MNREELEQLAKVELRKTDNLIYYLAGRLETSDAAGLEQLQEALQSNQRVIVALYEALLASKGADIE